MEANDDLQSQIVALRQAGRSRSEIQEALGPISTRLISEALRGTPPPEWTRRPRAKDDLHAEARKLRTDGMGYNEIAAQLGVSKARSRPGSTTCRPSARSSAIRMPWRASSGSGNANGPTATTCEPSPPARSGSSRTGRRSSRARHNPKTVRKNTGEDYRGCLVIQVRSSGGRYREIEGWMSAITSV